MVCATPTRLMWRNIAHLFSPVYKAEVNKTVGMTQTNVHAHDHLTNIWLKGFLLLAKGVVEP